MGDARLSTPRGHDAASRAAGRSRRPSLQSRRGGPSQPPLLTRLPRRFRFCVVALLRPRCVHSRKQTAQPGHHAARRRRGGAAKVRLRRPHAVSRPQTRRRSPHHTPMVGPYVHSSIHATHLRASALTRLVLSFPFYLSPPITNRYLSTSVFYAAYSYLPQSSLIQYQSSEHVRCGEYSVRSSVRPTLIDGAAPKPRTPRASSPSPSPSTSSSPHPWWGGAGRCKLSVFDP